MAEILTRACFFLLLVVLGYAVKKTGALSKEDGVALARVVLNITLPAAILVSFRTFTFDWAYMAMHWAVSNGIISGKGNDTLDPQGNATRAEVAQMLYNFSKIG